MSTAYTFAGSYRTVVDIRSGLPQVAAAPGRLVVCDATTHRLFCGSDADALVVPGRDDAKQWQHVADIIDTALSRGADRNYELVAVGGGAVCDLAGFAASILLRGVRLTYVPTTVTCMVDASLGGKTGINFGSRKNMVGTFYPANTLLVYPEAAGSLPERDYLSGLAEVIKTALLGDEELLRLLETRPEAVRAREPEVLGEMVSRCLALKGRVASADMREGVAVAVDGGPSPDAGGTSDPGREALNLGHTFGHALESASGMRWTHGEAVAWGLGRAVVLAERLGMMEHGYATRVWRLLDSYGYVLHQADVAADDLLTAMRADKKRRGDDLRFVLQRGLGVTEVRAVAEDDIRAALGTRDIGDGAHAAHGGTG